VNYIRKLFKQDYRGFESPPSRRENVREKYSVKSQRDLLKKYLVEDFGGMCIYCGWSCKRYGGASFHIEHIKSQNDNLNDYREEYNTMLLDKLKEGKNNITKEKYIIITIKATDLDTAFAKFSKLDSELSASIKRINGVETLPCTSIERLEMLADIYSETAENAEFYQKATLSQCDDLKEINKSQKPKNIIESFNMVIKSFEESKT